MGLLKRLDRSMLALHQNRKLGPNPPAPGLSGPQRQFLNTLRLVGRQCRSKAHEDLFEACAVLSCDPTKAATAYADTLMRCLSQALGKLPILHRPGETEVSFDEAWLLQLGAAIAREDQPSIDFLLRSRVHPHARRHCGFLMKAIVDQFSLI